MAVDLDPEVQMRAGGFTAVADLGDRLTGADDLADGDLGQKK